MGVNRLLPLRQEPHKVERLALQSWREGFGLLKNYLRRAHVATLPAHGNFHNP